MKIDLQNARGQFMASPDELTAMDYARTARRHFESERIGVDAAAAIAVELEAAGYKTAMLHLMS